MPTLSSALAGAEARTRERVARYRKKLVRGFDRWNLKRRERAWIEAMFGLRGTTTEPRLSDLRLRARASRIFAELLLAHRDERPDNRVYLHITFIDDSGNTTDRQPEFNLDAFKKKIGDALRGSFHAVAQIEAQALTNYPLPARTFMFHAHAIAWIDDDDWRAAPEKLAKEWADALNANPHWSCSFGAKPGVVEVIDETDHDLARVAAYISKVPNNAKWRTGDSERPLRSASADEGYRPALALRLGQVLSHFLITDMVFGICDGVALGNAWRKAVREFHQRRRATFDEGDAAQIAAMWAQLRFGDGRRRKARNGTSLYRRGFMLLAGDQRPASVHPEPIVDTDADVVERIRRQLERDRNGPLADL